MKFVQRRAAAEAELFAQERICTVRIAVRNSGETIAKEHLARLFDRFYRVDKARSGGSSNHGLGLSIVKAVTTMHLHSG